MANVHWCIVGQEVIKGHPTSKNWMIYMCISTGKYLTDYSNSSGWHVNKAKPCWVSISLWIAEYLPKVSIFIKCKTHIFLLTGTDFLPFRWSMNIKMALNIKLDIMALYFDVNYNFQHKWCSLKMCSFDIWQLEFNFSLALVPMMHKGR